MRLERELERLDIRIRATRDAIEAAYASSEPEARVEALFRSLALLEDERVLGRWYWADRVLAETLLVFWKQALRKLAGDFLKIARRYMPELRRLDEERKRSRPAFWRAMVPREGVAFAGAQAVGVNGRPVWSYRRKVGKR